MPPDVRVFVTGAAAATCCGLGCEALWEQLGKTARSTRAAQNGERPFSPQTLPPSSRRALHSDHRLTAYLLAAIEQDLGSFLSSLGDSDREATGIALGTAFGHVGAYLSYFETGTTHGHQLVNPRHFPHTLPNCTTVSISDAYTLWGSSTTLASGVAAGSEAIGYAAQAIRNGDEQTVLAGGADEINEGSGSAARRHRFVPAEGAAVLLLQSEDSAKATGREPLAEVGGAAHRQGICWESPESILAAEDTVRTALRESNLEPDSVDMVLPSLSGLPESDRTENELLRSLFGDRRSSLRIVPVTPTVGECFAALAPLQAVAAIHYLGFASTRAALVCTAGYDGSFSAIVLESQRDE